MKNNLRVISLFTALLCSLGTISVYAQVEIRTLHEGWEFRQARGDNWYPATVPGCIHTDLMDNEIIEDPFFRLGERAVQWVDKEDWFYQTWIEPTKAELAAENLEIVFKGLDTYADVYLNSHQLFRTDNMFREWRADIKPYLKEGKNHLEVYFHSPLKIDIPKWDSFPYDYSTGPDQAENGGIFNKRISIFARKAGYHYGWDWGPRLVTSGIWRDVQLEAWDNLRFRDVHYVQHDVTAQRAKMSTVVEIEADEAIEAAVISVKTEGKSIVRQRVNLQKGINKVDVNYTINKPKLWWTNGLGDAHLYQFTTSVEKEGKVVAEQTNSVGIRSLKLICKPDSEGQALFFELNGKPLFIKGSNMIPCDNFLPRVTDSIYHKTVLDARDVNMNMLRVWGGGIYEDDSFYNYCDKYGILVWQDFMFACSTYPADSVFLENVKQEAIYNVKRLRNHPSIAVWCGNNECQDIWWGWGNKKEYYANFGVEDKVYQEQWNLFFVTLPEVVKEYSGGLSYRPSCPFAFDKTPSDGINGDDHYWGVWHGRDSIRHYNVKRARFFSEYGFQSFPEYESVKIYAPEKRDHNITSEVMMCHQRAGSYANNLIRDYILDEYKEPKDFEKFLYVGQVLQGDAIKIAMEAHRRDRPYCMGTIVWQHNDCWPVASWSSRDYYGRWKAQHYFTRNAYTDVLVSPIEKDGRFQIYVVNDRLSSVRALLDVSIIDFKGNVIDNRTLKVSLPENDSKCVFDNEVAPLLKGKKANEVFCRVELTDGNKKVYSNNYFFAKQKDIDYPVANIKYDVVSVNGGYEVTLKSDVFARAVFLSLEGIDNFLSDNYFDLLPDRPIKITAQTGLDLNSFKKQLKVISLCDSY